MKEKSSRTRSAHIAAWTSRPRLGGHPLLDSRLMASAWSWFFSGTPNTDSHDEKKGDENRLPRWDCYLAATGRVPPPQQRR
ncbi:hypothetical protein [Pandoravirus japonicus]|uniref:Uncharacterized protein n=1 Tax=Pandoravirus japonicus TaxID=2823154 RepID=A0A811BMI9_9VIRU|nr:hypothetical protein [Pandoravirus japonicus]